MLPFTDHVSALDEPKTARMEQRTKPHVKAEIARAAALLGVDETTFVTSAAYARARATIKDHQLTVQAPEDQDAFLAALEAPSSVPQALKQAVRQHRRMVHKGA